MRSSAFYFVLVLPAGAFRRGGGRLSQAVGRVLQGICDAVLVRFTCLCLLLQADCGLEVLYLKLQALLEVLTYSFQFYTENPMQVQG